MRQGLTFVLAAALGAGLLAVAAIGRDDDPAPPASAREQEREREFILYTVGLSTDPYGNSAPAGFGVAVLDGERFSQVDEIRDADLGGFGGTDWIHGRRIVVPRNAPPFRRRLVFRLDGSGLVRERALLLPVADTSVAWSPDGRYIASEPVERCKSAQKDLWGCFRQSGSIYLQKPDGGGRRLVAEGHLDTWTPDGRLLVTSLDFNEPYTALDPASGRRELPLDPQRVGTWAGVIGHAVLGPPRWSADRRFIAAKLSGRWPSKETVAAIVIADAAGNPMRLLRSPYVISMFAWSPRGHRLAYTTSGFPDPHELFVVDTPGATARNVLTTERHFDWITWAPDSRRLLLDDPVENLWWLVPAQPPYTFVTSRRLGGKPFWCCPVNAYTTQ